MLEGPFSTDKKFIRYCNDNVIHIVYLQGPKKVTVKVKEDGLVEERCKYVPQLTAKQIDDIGQAVIEDLRDEKAPNKWRCPRVEIWSADRKPLVIHERPSRSIPNQFILKAIKEAQKKLGPSMSRKGFKKAMGLLDRADKAIAGAKIEEGKKALDGLDQLKGLTPAFKAEIQERRERLP